VTASETFSSRFGDLVALLRVDPGNDAAQDLALTAALHALRDGAVVVDAGFDRGEAGEDLTLQGRMRARYVDVLRVSPSAHPDALLGLARALSHDTTPLPSAPGIELEQFPMLERSAPPVPPPVYSPARAEGDRRRRGERRRWQGGRFSGFDRRGVVDRRQTGERRLRLLKQQQLDIQELSRLLGRAVAAGAWSEALEHASALIELAPRVPAVERRTFAIASKRHLSRAVLAGLVEHALREPADRDRTARVLRWAGADGIDVMLDAVCRSEVVGARRFLHEALGAIPEAYAVVAPLLASRVWHEVHHAAGIVGRIGNPDAVPHLRALLDHADPRVRWAAVHGLAEFQSAEAAEGVRAGLAHETAATRAAAADAIAGRRLASFAMLIVAALERERDAAAWRAMAGALAAIGTAEACAALVTIARTARFLGGGYTRTQRLEAVRALAHARTPHAVAALERLTRESGGAVRAAAAEELATRNASAG
jgi:hypothetical protein